jgi:hypothetical protein
MNAEAQRLGMTLTHFVNATGLPDMAYKASARPAVLQTLRLDQAGKSLGAALLRLGVLKA